MKVEHILALSSEGTFCRVLFPMNLQHLAGETSFVVGEIQKKEQQKKEQLERDRLNYGKKAG